MDKKQVMGVLFTVVGVAGGVLLATMIQKRIANKGIDASAE